MNETFSIRVKKVFIIIAKKITEGIKVERDLQEFLQKREDKLIAKKINDKKNGKILKTDTGTLNYDVRQGSVTQLKREDKISAFLIETLFEDREKSFIIAKALDGICPNCYKEQISVDLIKNLNLPICEKCKKTFIQKKIGLIIKDYLDNVMLKEKDKIDSYLASLQ